MSHNSRMSRRDVDKIINAMSIDEVIATLEDYDIPHKSKEREDSLRRKAVTVYIQQQKG